MEDELTIANLFLFVIFGTLILTLVPPMIFCIFFKSLKQGNVGPNGYRQTGPN